MNNWKINLVRQFLNDTPPEQAQEMLDTFLPLLCESLAPADRAALLQGIIERHLGTLLEGVGPEERATLLHAILPHLRREFPLDAPG